MIAEFKSKIVGLTPETIESYRFVSMKSVISYTDCDDEEIESKSL